MSSFRQEIATIENITEIVDGQEMHGNLMLSTEGEIFQIIWVILDDSAISWLNVVSKDPTQFLVNKWEQNTSFLVDVPKISNISFQPNPLQICINIVLNRPVRKFIIKNNNSEQFIEFIKQIISLGIALPTTKEPFSLEIYKRCHKSMFVFQPLHIQLEYNDDLDQLFTNIIKYSSDIVSYYDEKNVLPNDPMYPIGSLAVADIGKKISMIPVSGGKKVEESEWKTFFDEEGRFFKFEEVKRRVIAAGIDNKLIKDILPFVTNVFKPDSTQKERDEIMKKLVYQFKCLKVQATTLSPEQKANNSFIGPYSRVIDQDVKRTDRYLQCFKKDNSEGLKILTMLLNCYLICSPHVSYLQGMNDIFVPILTAFIPDWDEESSPICDDLDEKLALVFWCYDGLFKVLQHTNLLSDVTAECKRISSFAVRYIDQKSPSTKIWLKKSGNIELVFTFSDYVLLYKRSIPDIWRIWMVFLCKKNPANSLPLLTATVVVLGLPTLCSLNDWEMATMMTAYPGILEKIDTEEAIKVMLWLDSGKDDFRREQKENEKAEDIPNMNSFRYFKPGIIPNE